MIFLIVLTIGALLAAAWQCMRHRLDRRQSGSPWHGGRDGRRRGSPTGCGPCPSVDIGPRATADRAPTPSSEVTQVRLLANGREGETARAGRAPAWRGRPGTT